MNMTPGIQVYIYSPDDVLEPLVCFGIPREEQTDVGQVSVGDIGFVFVAVIKASKACWRHGQRPSNACTE